VAEEKDPTERAKELLVYGPIGLALYLRDTAPSFMKLFVARGRAELTDKRRSVGDHLGQAKAMGEFASAYGGSQAKNLLVDGFSKIKARAEETLDALGVLPRDDDDHDTADEPPLAVAEEPAATADADAAATNVDATTEVPGPPPIAATFDPPPTPTIVTPPPTNGAESDASSDGDATLAIPEYDELSASQVVDRLEGLTTADLEAIRTHELANRARNTILGKIDQLTREN
jgi:hypothetical protein